MKALIIIAAAGALALWPFVAMRRPWAVKAWERLKFFVVLYVAVVIVGAIVALIFRWDDFFG